MVRIFCDHTGVLLGYIMLTTMASQWHGMLSHANVLLHNSCPHIAFVTRNLLDPIWMGGVWSSSLQYTPWSKQFSLSQSVKEFLDRKNFGSDNKLQTIVCNFSLMDWQQISMTWDSKACTQIRQMSKCRCD